MARSHNVSLDKKKLTKRDQVLQADDFLQKSTGVVKWIEENEKMVLTGLVLFLLIAFGGVGVKNYIASSDHGTSHDFDNIVAISQVPITDPEAKTDEESKASESKIPGVPATFESKAKRNELFITKMLAFAADNSSTKLAGITNLYLGKAMREKGDNKAALSYFEKALKDPNLNPGYTFLTLENLGYTFEAMDKKAEAIETFKKLTKDNFYAAAGYYHQGRILMTQGKKKEAGEMFNKVKSEYPDSIFMQDAENRLKLIN